MQFQERMDVLFIGTTYLLDIEIGLQIYQYDVFPAFSINKQGNTVTVQVFQVCTPVLRSILYSLIESITNFMKISTGRTDFQFPELGTDSCLHHFPTLVVTTETGGHPVEYRPERINLFHSRISVYSARQEMSDSLSGLHGRKRKEPLPTGSAG